MLNLKYTAVLFSVLTMTSCGKSGNAKAAAEPDRAETVEVTVPQADADSAFAYVKAQTDMGPRNPGSAAHARIQDWIAARLGAFGADTVIMQRAAVMGPDGKRLPICNIMGRFNPEASRRLLLLAHYDTRPWADEDPDPANRHTPISGANDGASGVGVLMEIARHLGQNAPAVGVDLLFVDAEDSGSSSDESPSSDLTWCLGTQHWVTDMPYTPASLPEGAILLDMVGGRDAVFRQEYFSRTQAPALLEKVWRTAADAGFGARFIPEVGGAVNDDHLHLLANGIPAVDIIEIGHPETGSFNPTWHTLSDNIDNIDPETLRVVGQTVLNVVYKW